VSSPNHRFPPIGSYGFLSDCHTAALVSFGGSVEWLCFPRFDSPSTFAALLDRGAGHMSLRPKGVVVPISRRYVPGTLVIETTWVTETGWVVVKDALTIADWVAPTPNTSPTTRCCGR
jgi:alpha,alpha-trehalase